MNQQQIATRFDHERLDVYQAELRFVEWVTPLLDEVSSLTRTRTREVCDQLDRASLSALLNTAEGNGRRQRQTRAKFFDDARGSATECAACLDALVAKKAATADRIEEGKGPLLRIVSMLCRLVDRFDSTSNQISEDGIEYYVSGTERDTRTSGKTKKKS